MANLSDLPARPISQMSRGELLSHILTIRNARRVQVKPPKTTNKKSGKKSVARSPKDIIGMLSPEQAAKLLERLED